MTLNKKNILNKLTEVMDPELNISIVDLGLIYDVIINKDNKIKIIMTLTTMGCPLVGMIQMEIKDKIASLGVKENSITVDITFDPPWTMDKMTKKGKKLLGINYGKR